MGSWLHRRIHTVERGDSDVVFLDWYSAAEECTLVALNRSDSLFGAEFAEDFDVGEQEPYFLIIERDFPSCIVSITFLYNYTTLIGSLAVLRIVAIASMFVDDFELEGFGESGGEGDCFVPLEWLGVEYFCGVWEFDDGGRAIGFGYFYFEYFGGVAVEEGFVDLQVDVGELEGGHTGCLIIKL